MRDQPIADFFEQGQVENRWSIPTEFIDEQEVEEEIEEVEVEELEVELDPLEDGDSWLCMKFHDAATGEPVSGTVGLWRIDAPGNRDWNRGDQEQARLQVERGQVRVEGLPAGHYRTFAHFAAKGAASPRAFELGDAGRHVNVAVVMPTKRRVRLHLLRTDGVEVLSSDQVKVEMHWNRRRDIQSTRYESPPWRVERTPKNDDGLWSTSWSTTIGCCCCGAVTWSHAEASVLGIDLGELSGDTRKDQKTYSCDVRINGGTSFSIYLRLTGAAEYVAVLPNLKQVMAKLVLHVDTPPKELLDELCFDVTPVPVDVASGQTLWSEWKKSKSRLRLLGSGYKPIYVSWRPAEADLPRILVVAAAPPSEERTR